MNNYDIFFNCDNFKKLTGEIVSGKIAFDFKDFCNQYYHIFNNNFLEIGKFRNSSIISISFEKPSTLRIVTVGGKCKITNLQEISKILSEMAEEFETFASEYEDSLNEFSDFGL